MRILKKIKEESRQRGGFVRIFPTGDTFEYFSCFFEQRTTCFNQMVHQRLYPSRWTNTSPNAQPTTHQHIRRTTVPRSKHLSAAFHQGTTTSPDKESTGKTNGSDLAHALARYRIYQRRLIDIVSANGVNDGSKGTRGVSPTERVKGNLSTSSFSSANTSSGNEGPQREKNSLQRDESRFKRLTSVSQLGRSDKGTHSVYAKNEMAQLFHEGSTLR